MFRTVLLSIIRSFFTVHTAMVYVSKPVWHLPLLCVQWKTPDDGKRNCPKHVEFHSKNKFWEISWFYCKKFVTMHGHMNIKNFCKFYQTIQRHKPQEGNIHFNYKFSFISILEYREFLLKHIHYFYGDRGGTVLRCCATNRKVAGSIPYGVIGNFHWHNPSDRTMALGSTQPLTEMSTRRIS